MNKNKTRKARPLVINRLEKVSKDVFTKYYPAITDLIGNSPGLYALYDTDQLYYVGKSTDLKMRVRHHLRDRHLASWSHFSLYLVRREEHIHELEGLLIRIANPKGNRVTPKAESTGALVKELMGAIRTKQKEELIALFGDGRRARTRTAAGSRRRPERLAGLVSKRATLFRQYKGREYIASLSPSGLIRYNGKTFSSPTGAAKAVIKKDRAVNGWAFWYISNKGGDWVRLMDYEE